MANQSRWDRDDGDFATECQQRVVEAMRVVGWHLAAGDEVLLVSLSDERKFIVETNGTLTEIA